MSIPIIPLLGLLLIIAIAWWAMSQLTLPPPFRMIIVVVLAVICILLVGQIFGVFHEGALRLSSTVFGRFLA